MSKAALELFDKHEASLRAAGLACRERGYFTLFPETPDRHRGGAAATEAGIAAFRAQLGRPFVLDQPGTVGRIGGEISPYTLEPLGIDYPRADIDALFAAAHSAMPTWAAATPGARLGVCMEIVDRLYENVFETAQAVMHTAGQSGPMSYAGSGTNALDRGVEAIAYAQAAMSDVPAEALWERRFGSTTIRLRKRYQLVPRGVAVCFACATFPTWNAYPAMLASLATGNPVIVKPHPTAILPMALAVRTFRDVIASAGFSPDLVTLCLDTAEVPVGKLLVKHPQTAIVDFTGQCALRFVGRGERPPRTLLFGNVGREHGRRGIGGPARAGDQESRHDDEPVLGADVHVATKHLRAARRDSSCRWPHRCG